VGNNPWAAKEGTRALRQSAQKIEEPLAWKEEVNRRVAEHKGRKIAGVDLPQTQVETQSAAGNRAAAAAARVAARYAKAPSYSAMMAEEARAAVRAAEAASKGALQAQAAAEQVLAGLEAVSSSESAWEPEFFTSTAPEPVGSSKAEPVRGYSSPAVRPAIDPLQQDALRASEEAPQTTVRSAGSLTPKRAFEIRWDADLPVREQVPAAPRAFRGESVAERSAEPAWEQPTEDQLDMHNYLGGQGYGVVEPALPIHANLIEFPRELIATRKVRPRRVEGPHAATAEEQGQLSIFEVDPYSVSSEPEALGAIAEANAATWAGATWSGIELDEEPPIEYTAGVPAYAPEEPVNPAVAGHQLHVAPINQRIMAAVVDLSLISGAFLTIAFVVLMNMSMLPKLKQLESASAIGLVLMGLSYVAFFLVVWGATPGMKYARLEILTAEGDKPNQFQRLRRTGALLLSMAPIGLGAAMALFDEHHLCWHDRLSGTYLRRR
jgi:uncharacterized RDD family membrane protein YckC